MAQCTGCGQGNTDLYGLVRTDTDMGTGCSEGYVLWEFRERMAHTHLVPIVRQVRPVRPVRPVRHSLPTVSTLHNVLCQPTEHTALCYRNSKAHGTQAAIDHLQYSRYSQYSWFLCSHTVPCTMCPASQRECAMFFRERTAHGARGETSLSPRVPPFRPCVVKRPAARNAASLRLEALASSPPRAVRRRLSARCHSAAPNILGAVAAPLCSDSLPRPLRARHSRPRPVC